MGRRAVFLSALLLTLVASVVAVRAAWQPWSDHPLNPNVTAIRDDHINELRNNVNELEQNAANLACRRNPITAWGEAITPNVTLIRASHINEIVAAVTNIKNACGAPCNAMALPGAVAAGQPIQAAHITNLRTALTTLQGVCGAPVCGIVGVACAGNLDCCSNNCNLGTGLCEPPVGCKTGGMACAGSGECCSGLCGDNGQCCDTSCSVGQTKSTIVDFYDDCCQNFCCPMGAEWGPWCNGWNVMQDEVCAKPIGSSCPSWELLGGEYPEWADTYQTFCADHMPDCSFGCN